MPKPILIKVDDKDLTVKQVSELINLPYHQLLRLVNKHNCKTLDDVKNAIYIKEKFHVGDVYGKYTIISEKYTVEDTHYVVNVRCECGKEDWKLLSDLKSGRVRGCASCMARTRSRKVKVGDQYKHWKVIDGPISSKHQCLQWKVLCCKCNSFVRWMQANELMDPNSSFMCLKCSQAERGKKERLANGGTEYLSINKYHKWEKSAKRRNYEFSVSIEYLTELYLSQDKKCAITGEYLPDLEKASLDRIDSTKGYVQGNLQWVTIQANLSKHIMSMENLYEFCKKVLNHANQQPSQPLTKLEGSETNDWNSYYKNEYEKCMNDFTYFKTNYVKVGEYNIDTSAEHLIQDDDIVRHSLETERV